MREAASGPELRATLPPAASPSQQVLGLEDEEASLDDGRRPKRSDQERSCCQHQPPEPWWTREKVGDQVPELREEKDPALSRSWG
ncbi:nuclear protein 1 isoform X2 [Cavia porcellus]|uniref:nuclear protein 1 isoform X2 n=1 Tax=Cavia porcellus TaxID=10141 RepID=UPI002FE3F7F9